MATILILYSSVDGHTIKICHRLKQVIEENNHQVTVLSIEDYRWVDLPSFDQIVIGASIRYGRHRQSVYDFIDRHLSLLESKANAFFSVNIVARKPEKNQPETNPYLRKFLRQIAWRPDQLAVFAGRLDYPKYRFIDRQMIRLIMWITKGPTDPATVVEFTDWLKVEEFGRGLGRSLTADLPSVPDAL
jgi:menaquinone-dependent protoporphyrinogen oxidase